MYYVFRFGFCWNRLTSLVANFKFRVANFCSICSICFIYTAPQACSFKHKPCINIVALPFFTFVTVCLSDRNKVWGRGPHTDFPGSYLLIYALVVKTCASCSNELDQHAVCLQMNLWKIVYLNCGERYEFMIDHRSYTHNLSNLLNFFQALISKLLKFCV